MKKWIILLCLILFSSQALGFFWDQPNIYLTKKYNADVNGQDWSINNVWGNNADFNSITTKYFVTEIDMNVLDDLNGNKGYFNNLFVNEIFAEWLRATDINASTVQANDFFGTFHGTLTGLPQDTTLDTNGTAETSWLGKQHTWTNYQTFNDGIRIYMGTGGYGSNSEMYHFNDDLIIRNTESNGDIKYEASASGSVKPIFTMKGQYTGVQAYNATVSAQYANAYAPYGTATATGAISTMYSCDATGTYSNCSAYNGTSAGDYSFTGGRTPTATADCTNCVIIGYNAYGERPNCNVIGAGTCKGEGTNILGTVVADDFWAQASTGVGDGHMYSVYNTIVGADNSTWDWYASAWGTSNRVSGRKAQAGGTDNNILGPQNLVWGHKNIIQAGTRNTIVGNECYLFESKGITAIGNQIVTDDNNKMILKEEIIDLNTSELHLDTNKVTFDDNFTISADGEFGIFVDVNCILIGRLSYATVGNGC